MLKKRIKALNKFALNTRIDAREFNKDDVAIIKFESEGQYKALLGFGNFKEVYNPVKVVSAPIVIPSGGGPPVPVIGKPVITEKVKGKTSSGDSSLENVCGTCSRVFATARGLSMHIVKAHKTDFEKTEKIDKPIEELCTSCGVKMVVVDEKSLAGKSVEVSLFCPVCNKRRYLVVEKK